MQRSLAQGGQVSRAAPGMHSASLHVAVPKARWLAMLILLLAIVAHGDAEGALRGSGPPLSQVLVFDAGSSGTRIHIFNMRMPPGAAVPTIDLAVRETQMLKVKPGLSHFAKLGDLEGCQKNIESLLTFANQFVAPERRSSTPCLLKATAGLRAVGEEKAELVLNRVRDTFKASPYNFLRDDWASVIKGKEEAGLAWVAANYLRGTFSSTAAEGATSLGVIEMGGGSTQVTFQVSNTDKVADIDRFEFTTALGLKYSLYAHSYLNFGQDYAQNSLREVLPVASLEDPCYPVGYLRKSSSGEIVKGSANAELCKSKIREHVLAAPTAPGRYSAELLVRGPFVATENFFYVRKDVATAIGVLDSTGSDEKGACAKSMTPTNEEVTKMQLGSADAGKPNYCFGLSYQAELLTALKAFSVTGVEVEVKRQINGGDIDWALGAALLHYMEELSPTRQGGNQDLGSGLGWTPFLLALLAGVLLLASAVRFVIGRNQQRISMFTSTKDSDTEQPTKMGMSRLPQKLGSSEVGSRTPKFGDPAE